MGNYYFWQKLKQRIDFLFYAYALKQDTGICPHEIDSISADCLFELVEREILRLNLSYDEIIIDELYRAFVSYVKGEYNPDENYNYEYFCAPYFSSQVYEELPRQGSIYLEQFTKELFSNPLQQLTRQLCHSL